MPLIELFIVTFLNSLGFSGSASSQAVCSMCLTRVQMTVRRSEVPVLLRSSYWTSGEERHICRGGREGTDGRHGAGRVGDCFLCEPPALPRRCTAPRPPQPLPGKQAFTCLEDEPSDQPERKEQSTDNHTTLTKIVPVEVPTRARCFLRHHGITFSNAAHSVLLASRKACFLDVLRHLQCI